jgi:hypothetical protein
MNVQGDIMKKTFVIALLCCIVLSACGPSAPDQAVAADQTTAVAASGHTALAPTGTPTLTPVPSSTPRPTATQVPPSRTPTQTRSPGAVGLRLTAKAVTAVAQEPTRRAMWLQDDYTTLINLDVFLGRIVDTASLAEEGKITPEKAVVRMQTYHHMVRWSQHYAELYDGSFYNGTIREAIDSTLAALGLWWLGQSGDGALAQEVAAINTALSPLRAQIRAELVEQGADLSFEQETYEMFGGKYPSAFHAHLDRMLAYEAEHDIFIMQRDHRNTLFGQTSVVGAYDDDGQYTAPDGSYSCSFAYEGIGGDFLYDFVFPARTVVVFTNDFAIGQAVDRQPLSAALDNEGDAREAVDTFYARIILPALMKEYPSLEVLQQEWVNTGRPMLQVVLSIPEASFIESTTSAGTKSLDVVRGLWMFVEGDAIYTVIYQESPDFGLPQDPKSEAELVQAAVQGLDEILKTCSFHP